LKHIKLKGVRNMTDNKFNVWTFKGVIQYKCNGTELEKMSLEKCLKEVFNTVWDNTVKKFFDNRNMSFDCREYSAEELWKEVGKGLSIFSISENFTYLDPTTSLG
jgi:hypothetical protein